MALKDSWHIRSRARKCTITEKPFEEGETIVTALFPDPESSGYLRRDFSVESWDARTEDDAPAFSVWRSTYEPPEEKEDDDPMRKEDPETLLRRLVDEDEEHTENVRYILAVMLERQKLLRETDSQAIPSGVLRVYEHRKTGDAFLIRDPNIPLDEVEKVQEEVILLLEHGGRRPEPEAETPEQTETAAEGETNPEPQDEAESEDEDEDASSDQPESVESEEAASDEDAEDSQDDRAQEPS